MLILAVGLPWLSASTQANVLEMFITRGAGNNDTPAWAQAVIDEDRDNDDVDGDDDDDENDDADADRPLLGSPQTVKLATKAEFAFPLACGECVQAAEVRRVTRNAAVYDWRWRRPRPQRADMLRAAQMA